MRKDRVYHQRASKTVLFLGFVLGAIAGCAEPAESEEDDFVDEMMEEEPSTDVENLKSIDQDPRDLASSKYGTITGTISETNTTPSSPNDPALPQKCVTPSCRKLGTPVLGVRATETKERTADGSD